MKRLVLATLTVGALALGSLTPAMAQGGCGPYGHRGWDGGCHPGGFRPHPGWGYGWHRYHHWHGGPYGWHRGW